MPNEKHFQWETFSIFVSLLYRYINKKRQHQYYINKLLKIEISVTCDIIYLPIICVIYNQQINNPCLSDMVQFIFCGYIWNICIMEYIT